VWYKLIRGLPHWVKSLSTTMQVSNSSNPQVGKLSPTINSMEISEFREPEGKRVTQRSILIEELLTKQGAPRAIAFFLGKQRAMTASHTLLA
jgi:hypothetical protein